jgi:hypothetical protein
MRFKIMANSNAPMAVQARCAERRRRLTWPTGSLSTNRGRSWARRHQADTLFSQYTFRVFHVDLLDVGGNTNNFLETNANRAQSRTQFARYHGQRTIWKR